MQEVGKELVKSTEFCRHEFCFIINQAHEKVTHLMKAQVVLYSRRGVEHVTFSGDRQHKAIESLR